MSDDRLFAVLLPLSVLACISGVFLIVLAVAAARHALGCGRAAPPPAPDPEGYRTRSELMEDLEGSPLDDAIKRARMGLPPDPEPSAWLRRGRWVRDENGEIRMLACVSFRDPDEWFVIGPGLSKTLVRTSSLLSARPRRGEIWEFRGRCRKHGDAALGYADFFGLEVPKGTGRRGRVNWSLKPSNEGASILLDDLVGCCIEPVNFGNGIGGDLNGPGIMDRFLSETLGQPDRPDRKRREGA